MGPRPCPILRSKQNKNLAMIWESVCDTRHTNLLKHFNGHTSNYTDGTTMWLPKSVLFQFTWRTCASMSRNPEKISENLSRLGPCLWCRETRKSRQSRRMSLCSANRDIHNKNMDITRWSERGIASPSAVLRYKFNSCLNFCFLTSITHTCCFLQK